MRISIVSVMGFILLAMSPAYAGQWGGSITMESINDSFTIKYPNRSNNTSAGLEAQFQDAAITGTYSFGKNAVSMKLVGNNNPKFDHFYGGNGNWDEDGNPCTASTCPQAAERTEFSVTYSRRLQGGISLYGGFYDGTLSWTETQGRAYRAAAGNNGEIANICETNGQTVKTTSKFSTANWGVFVGGAYGKAFTDKLFGTARFAIQLGSEADVQESYRCADGRNAKIGSTGTLFEGNATSFGLSLFYAINQNSGLVFARDSKNFSYDNGTDYWSGGSANTEQYTDTLSIGYVFSF